VPTDSVDVRNLVDARAGRPGAVAEAAAARRKPTSMLGPTGRLMVIAADHPARGALRAGSDPLAMADRVQLLERLCLALSRPEVNGVLGTPDIVEDLLLLGALDDKVVIGSMNRGGAVTALADRQLVAMVEPFLSSRVDGRLRNDLSTEAVVRSVTVAAGLGATSAYTWLKLPVTEDVAGMEQVLAASTLPAVLLGGEVPDDPDAAFAAFERVLSLPTAKGLVVGRSLLYPTDGDVVGAVDRAVSLL
jgi:hypothetical protein